MTFSRDVQKNNLTIYVNMYFHKILLYLSGLWIQKKSLSPMLCLNICILPTIHSLLHPKMTKELQIQLLKYLCHPMKKVCNIFKFKQSFIILSHK